MEALKHKFREWLGLRHELTVPADAEAEFLLILGNLPVGTLSVHGGVWQFEYSEEFKQSPELRPLVEFPDLDKVYRQEELWQFFASRIPSVLQPDVERVLERESIEEDDMVALLRRFGKRTIASPFELSYRKMAA